MPSEQPPRGVAQHVSIALSEEFRRFRRGELTETEYLQKRMDRATQHLRGRVPSRNLDRIRQIVAGAVATDPVCLGIRARLFGPRKTTEE